ncbi:pyridoxamine kinase [Oscillospiraceae bacterium MB08-C2-2]|nr:pyridoxamine kinase [Oscillospiraceae bacterium MB08-C2-2]
MQKRIAAIHDISCFGRCSLTVALPILSAAGIEASVIPTAILSTHTGGFSGYTYRDLTEDILPIAQHWQSLGLTFDALYTGYLGSFEQLELVSRLFDTFGTGGNLLFVDPVMADNGKLYASFAPEFPQGMARLCAKADVIVPNLTEAALLLGREYTPGPYTKAYIEKLLKELAELGPGKVFLTGVYFDEEQVGTAAFDKATGEIAYAMAGQIPGYYHGTGDVFGSALLAALMAGKPLQAAGQIAVDFTVAAIERTYAAKTDDRCGVNFEAGLGELSRQLV